MLSTRTPFVRLTISCALIGLVFGCTSPPESPAPQPPPVPPKTVQAPAPKPAPVSPTKQTPAPEAKPPARKQEPVAPKPEIPAATTTARLLARQLRLPPGEVQVVQVTPANWPNSCLGLPAEGEICAMMITPGYAVGLTAAGQRYEFRTDESGQRIRLASAPLAESGEALLTWSDSHSFSVLVVGTENVAFGRRGGPLLTVPLTNPDRGRELLYFLGTFAPIQKQTSAGEIVLRSVGTTVASPAQQRMIAEWARLVRNEADSGQAQPTADRVLVWQRTGGIAGFCDEVVIGLTGMATASDCSDPDARIVARLVLEADELAELYAWIDGYEPFSWISDATGAVADAMTVTVDFQGTGLEPLTETRAGELLDFVNRIVDRLMASKAEN